MRKNIFLHFLNRDTREIFRVYDVLGKPQHAQVLREPLNAAALLCEDACYAPPGFVLEDDIAFELFESQSSFLEAGLVRLPLRERSLADYAEKKRGEYAPAKNRYSGLYDDSRLIALSSYAGALTSRRAQIGPAIVSGFESGVDTSSDVWKKIKSKASPEAIRSIRETPLMMAEQGKALTWSIMAPNFNPAAQVVQVEVRDALQHVYFKEYCREFRLILLSDVPYMPEIFYLPSDRKVYSFRRFKDFLSCFHCSQMLLRGSSDFIIRIRSSSGFVDLMDSYVQLAEIFPSDGDLRYHVSRAVERVSFSWVELARRRAGALNDPTEIETLEITDAFNELAVALTSAHGLRYRAAKVSALSQSSRISVVGVRNLKIAIFVALEEELDVLVAQLGFKKAADKPAASGKIGDIDVDVLCPRDMGRVPAAVEVTRYLSTSKALPEMVFCVGLAGGFAEAKIDAGTVICCTTVVDLANRKVLDGAGGEAVNKFRRQDFACSRALYTVASSHEFDQASWEGYCRANFDWPKGRVPSLREGKIACVDEVVSSDKHRTALIAGDDKLLGVEMEAGGVCAAAHESDIPVAVIRVVSDMADPAKADDQWRRTGMKTLVELLKRIPLQRVIEVSRGAAK